MPPDGFTALMISDELAGKLGRIMSRYECDSYPEAVEYAVNATLAQEDELSSKDLLEMLANRID